MARCEGTTKSGERCRRQATGGSAYCSSHEAQAQSEPDPTVENESDRDGTEDAAGTERSERESRRHPLAAAAVIGVAAVVLLALRRVIRF